MNLRFNESDLMMIGEDSHYLKARPGAFLTGCGNPEIDAIHPHHSPCFNMMNKR